jgi:hypothetical protein
VELSLDGLLVAAGLHAPASDQLERYRGAINDGRRAAAFAPSRRREPRDWSLPPEPKRTPAATRSTTRGSTGSA